MREILYKVHLLTCKFDTPYTTVRDLAFFRLMKGAWRSILLEYKMKTNGSPTPKSDSPKLRNKLIEKCVKGQSQSLVSGFRKAGIVSSL